jgi:hypothetical protein
MLEHAVAMRDEGVVCSICQHHASAEDMSLQQLAALAEEALQERYTVAGAAISIICLRLNPYTAAPQQGCMICTRKCRRKGRSS